MTGKELYLLSIKDSNKAFAYLADIARKYEQYGIWASAVLAMARVESGEHFGSRLAIQANNLFGVKAKRGEPFVRLQTEEFTSGVKNTQTAKFRVYDSVEESICDVCEILCGDRYEEARKSVTPESALIKIQMRGYASAPYYPKVCRDVISDYNLWQYDTETVKSPFKVLRSGRKGHKVLGLQIMLNALGYNLTLDGKYGKLTKTAVKDFQGKNGLKRDGIVGIKTYMSISERI